MMQTLLEAMARQEGFYAPGTLPNRRNNPGDIEDGEFAQAHGALPPDGHRFAAFPDAATGFAAMRALLTEHYLGLTLEEALNKWAPPVENDTNIYLQHVSEWTGLSADAVLTADIIG
jgi:hypothetical protein